MKHLLGPDWEFFIPSFLSLSLVHDNLRRTFSHKFASSVSLHVPFIRWVWPVHFFFAADKGQSNKSRTQDEKKRRYLQYIVPA